MPLPNLRPPSTARLLRTLQDLFRAQAREVMTQYSLDRLESGDELPELGHWDAVMAQVVRPTLLPFWQHGVLRSKLRQARLMREPKKVETEIRETNTAVREHDPNLLLHAPEGRRFLPAAEVLGKGVMSNGSRADDLFRMRWQWGDIVKAAAPRRRPVTPAPGRLSPVSRRPPPISPARMPAQSMSFSFDLYNPKVLTAVDDAVFRFCRETNATATVKLGEAREKLKRLLKRGLKRGDAVALLAKKVREVFADPFRAFRIAATESSRGIHGGALLAAKENPEVGGKRWLASPDACDRCLDLDGDERLLDEPFYIDPKGGPYSVCNYPPLHPH